VGKLRTAILSNFSVQNQWVLPSGSFSSRAEPPYLLRSNNKTYAPYTTVLGTPVRDTISIQVPRMHGPDSNYPGFTLIIICLSILSSPSRTRKSRLPHSSDGFRYAFCPTNSNSFLHIFDTGKSTFTPTAARPIWFVHLILIENRAILSIVHVLVVHMVYFLMLSDTAHKNSREF
jgi:hypothetical protein